MVSGPLPTVLVTHPVSRLNGYFGDQALAELRRVAKVRLNGLDEDLGGPALVDAAQGCAVVIAYRQTPFDGPTLQALPDLRAVVRCAVDIRTIDVSAASQCGILVTQASAGFMASVSEWVIGVMVDMSRSISASAEAYHAGRVVVPSMGRELRGAALGIIGYGQIARYLCPVAQALGMSVCVTDPYTQADVPGVRQTDLPALLAVADYVVCLAPATAATENLVNEKAFALMKPGAFFINASRGNLVDEAALLAALDDGRVGAAALDVGRAPDQMPSLALARHPRVIATPHIGGLTPPAILHQALETVAQTTAILQGCLPRGAVNGAHAKRLQQTLPPGAPRPS